MEKISFTEEEKHFLTEHLINRNEFFEDWISKVYPDAIPEDQEEFRQKKMDPIMSILEKFSYERASEFTTIELSNIFSVCEFYTSRNGSSELVEGILKKTGLDK
jgi:hypothetical protein